MDKYWIWRIKAKEVKDSDISYFFYFRRQKFQNKLEFERLSVGHLSKKVSRGQ